MDKIRQKDGFHGERSVVLPQSVVKDMESHPLAAILHPTDVGFYPQALHHFRERTEPIAQHVLIYCTGGAGWYSVDGTRYAVGENEYFILPAGRPHAYGADETHPWTIYWVHFKGKLSTCFLPRTAGPLSVPPGHRSRISERHGLFDEMLATLEMGYSQENLLYACSLLYHYVATLRYLHTYRGVAPGSENDLVTATIHLMRENIEKRLTLEEMAHHAGYSPSHFSKLFSDRTGHAPLTYFNQLKVQQACRLLDFTHLRVNQICFKLGFDDPYYFSRLFRKVMGISPQAYRGTKRG